MRILMLTQFYPPLMGGIERHVQALSRELAARGHEVWVATLLHRGLAAVEQADGVHIRRLRGSAQRLPFLFTADRQHAPPLADPEITLGLQNLLNQFRPEVVHAHDWMVRSFLPLKRRRGPRLVRTLHDCELTCAQMRFMYRDAELCPGPSLTRCLDCCAHHYGPLRGTVTCLGNWITAPTERRRVDAFIPVSRAIGRANHLDPTAANVHVIPNFVPDEIAAGAEVQDERLSALPREKFILQVGDLTRDKGIHVLLEAYAGLSSPPPLVLIGRRLPETPRDLPAGVTILESLPHALVMQAWKRSLFATVPSLCMDASPTVTLEAMACGRAVIGSNIGGIADQIVDGETGLLVRPGDVEGLRQAMARLIADADLRQRMERAARERVRSFQAGQVVGRIEEVYGIRH